MVKRIIAIAAGSTLIATITAAFAYAANGL